MQLTNKKLAFYIALILAGLVFALLILDIVTLAQAQLALATIGAACIPFGLADVVYDYLGLMVKIGEHAAAATPSLEDDKTVAEFKAIIEAVRERIEPPATETATITATGGKSFPLIDPAIKARIEAPVETVG